MRKSALLAFALAGVLVGAPAVSAAPSATDTSALRNAVTVNGIMKHEKALQQIANANGGTRASGTPGFDASRDYVVGKLKAAGYDVKVQPFNFDFFTELSPPIFDRTAPTARTYTLGTDFQSMEYSATGDVTGAVVATNDIVIPPGAKDSTSNSGCESNDFAPASATQTQVALIQRGTCDFIVKARNAQAAGYDAAVIFNEGQPGRTDVINGTLGATDVTIPVIDATFAVGEELYGFIQKGQTPVVHIVTNTTSETRSTSNVIADLRGGRTDRTVAVGAHLDSVPEGPGINDDGSGTATDLEVALQMAKTKTVNHVRFLWFGAEEAGLIGSQRYVASLTNQQQHDIMAMLDFDMLASPNFVRFVYDGDGSEPDNPAGPSGSGTIEEVFNNFWDAQGLDTEPTAFDGRSDYDSFTAVGIPAGGIFAGAEGIKTAEEALIYGGTAGEPYDECYHLACDTLKNLNLTALDQFSDAVAHSTLAFAQTTSAVNGTDTSSGTSSTETKGHFKVR
jgi:Zn-dependent M28 family amino/carboxypeptidase